MPSSDGVAVGAEHSVAAGESRNEEQKGRARQGGGGDEGVDDPEAITGVDEKIGTAAARADPAGLVGGPFEGASRGSAHGNDPAALGARAIDCFSRRGRDLPGLGVEPMLLNRP